MEERDRDSLNGKKYPRDWEQVNAYMRRIHVPGGWIVHTYTNILIGGKEAIASEAMTFVPDPNLDWVLEERDR